MSIKPIFPEDLEFKEINELIALLPDAVRQGDMMVSETVVPSAARVSASFFYQLAKLEQAAAAELAHARVIY